jgi:hypothetical protein
VSIGPKLRVARPTDNLKALGEMYRRGLGFELLGAFSDHDGFDGIMLGHPGAAYHLEFTAAKGHHAGRAPTEDNLLVFYLPEDGEWRSQCAKLLAAGFVGVTAFNPYWDKNGRTFEDIDGYRVVLQHTAWER